MTTELITIGNDNYEAIKKAADYLIKGEAIAFSTDTVYGVGANIFDEAAVEKVFEAKNRNYNMPLAAHIGDLGMINELAYYIPKEFYLLAEAFLPGPLSIIIPKNKENVSSLVTSGLPTIAIRYPDDEIFLRLIEFTGFPIAATSANISTQPSAKSGKEAYEALSGKIAAVLDSGPTKYLTESSIITLCEAKPRMLREGAIEKYKIEEVLSEKL